MRYNQNQNRITDADKHAINEVFKAMRKRGYLAKQNYLCCMGCASAALATLGDTLKDHGKDPRGCVYYHRQDTEHWKSGKSLFLRFGNFDTIKYGEYGASMVTVGNELCEELMNQDLHFIWNGDPSMCVEVTHTL